MSAGASEISSGQRSRATVRCLSKAALCGLCKPMVPRFKGVHGLPDEGPRDHDAISARRDAPRRGHAPRRGGVRGRGRGRCRCDGKVAVSRHSSQDVPTRPKTSRARRALPTCARILHRAGCEVDALVYAHAWRRQARHTHAVDARIFRPRLDGGPASQRAPGAIGPPWRRLRCLPLTCPTAWTTSDVLDGCTKCVECMSMSGCLDVLMQRRRGEGLADRSGRGEDCSSP